MRNVYRYVSSFYTDYNLYYLEYDITGNIKQRTSDFKAYEISQEDLVVSKSFGPDLNHILNTSNSSLSDLKFSELDVISSDLPDELY